MKIRERSLVSPLPDDELIKGFEEQYKIEFPESYKEFLKEYNGAIPENDIFNHEEREYFIERFLCLLQDLEADKQHRKYDINFVIGDLDKRLIVDKLIGECKLIPIIALVSGNYVCLDFRKSKTPTISVWLDYASEDFKPVTNKVADSFEKFLKLLRE